MNEVVVFVLGFFVSALRNLLNALPCVNRHCNAIFFVIVGRISGWIVTSYRQEFKISRRRSYLETILLLHGFWMIVKIFNFSYIWCLNVNLITRLSKCFSPLTIISSVIMSDLSNTVNCMIWFHYILVTCSSELAQARLSVTENFYLMC